MTQQHIIKSFWQDVKTDRKLLRQKNKKDFLGQHTSEIRNAFVEYVERLRSEKVISDETANTIKL